jgi:hypothetical protein
MARPNREHILNNVVTSLQAIATASSFKLTQVTVERRIYDPQAIPVNATPWFGVVPGGAERFTYQPGGMLWCTLPIVVAGAVAIAPTGTQTEAERLIQVASILDDIKYALCGTAALSERGTHVNDAGQTVPNAVQTIILSQWGDEAHEIPVTLESGYVIAYAVVQAEVTYQQSRGHS